MAQLEVIGGLYPNWAEDFLAQKRALMVAVTGGIGSGKSQVTSILQRCGAKTCSADQFAGQALIDLQDRLAQVFDRPEWAKTGVDRGELAQIVFNDPAARKQLETITHPYIAFQADRHFSQLAFGQIGVYDIPLLAEQIFPPLVKKNNDVLDPKSTLVTEKTSPKKSTVNKTIAMPNHGKLTLSDGKEKPRVEKILGRNIPIPVGYDIVITVSAPMNERIIRLAARSGLNENQVKARIQAQATDEQRQQLSHYQVVNDTDLRDLQRLIVGQLWPDLLDLADGLVPDSIR